MLLVRSPARAPGGVPAPQTAEDPIRIRLGPRPAWAALAGVGLTLVLRFGHLRASVGATRHAGVQRGGRRERPRARGPRPVIREPRPPNPLRRSVPRTAGDRSFDAKRCSASRELRHGARAPHALPSGSVQRRHPSIPGIAQAGPPVRSHIHRGREETAERARHRRASEPQRERNRARDLNRLLKGQMELDSGAPPACRSPSLP